MIDRYSKSDLTSKYPYALPVRYYFFPKMTYLNKPASIQITFNLPVSQLLRISSSYPYQIRIKSLIHNTGIQKRTNRGDYSLIIFLTSENDPWSKRTSFIPGDKPFRLILFIPFCRSCASTPMLLPPASKMVKVHRLHICSLSIG